MGASSSAVSSAGSSPVRQGASFNGPTRSGGTAVAAAVAAVGKRRRPPNRVIGMGRKAGAPARRCWSAAVGDAGEEAAPVAEAVKNTRSSGPSAARHIGLWVWIKVVMAWISRWLPGACAGRQAMDVLRACPTPIDRRGLRSVEAPFRGS